MGQTRKSALAIAMSAFHPIATKLRTSREVRFVPASSRHQHSAALRRFCLSLSADRIRRPLDRLPNKGSTYLGNRPPASKSP
jgi:hypothetical protein